MLHNLIARSLLVFFVFCLVMGSGLTVWFGAGQAQRDSARAATVATHLATAEAISAHVQPGGTLGHLAFAQDALVRARDQAAPEAPSALFAALDTYAQALHTLQAAPTEGAQAARTAQTQARAAMNNWTATVHARVARYTLLGWAVLGAFMLWAAGAWLMLVRGVLLRLRRIEREARRMLAGEPPEFKAVRRDEVGALESTLYDVADRMALLRDEADRLLEAEQFNRTLTDSVQEGVIVYDRELRFVRVNRFVEEQVGVKEAEMIGRHPWELFPHMDEQGSSDMLRAALAGTTVTSPDLSYFCPRRKEEIWYTVTMSPLRDVSGEVAGVVSILHDVTKRREVEHELRRAKLEAESVADLRRALLNNLSHEIRTPLASIIGFAQLMRDMGDPESVEMFAGQIEDGGNRLLETLNAFLHLAEIESGALELQREAVSVYDETERVLDLFTPMARRQGLILNADVPFDVFANTDARALGRALNNLVSNAIKFTEEGEVRVTAFRNGEMCEIQVADTGVGISPEFVPHMFEEFSQESTGLSRMYEGSGLGLAITEKLVKHMGGSIRVESEVGVGSTFFITLPAIEVNAHTVTSKAA